MMKQLILFIFILFGFVQLKSQVASNTIQALTSDQLLQSVIVSDSVKNNNPVEKPEACVIGANDNFVAATNLPIGFLVGGSTCGSIQAGETTACMGAFAGVTSVWYKFTATAATMYVQVIQTGGGCFCCDKNDGRTAPPLDRSKER